MKDPEFLEKFVGEYELNEQTLTVALSGNVLTATVPGQPTFTLEPYKGTEFKLKGIPGYSVKFTLEGGKSTEATFIQPNGIFTAKRVK